MDPSDPFGTITSTRDLDPSSRAHRWSESVARTYFPLDITFADAERFEGEIVGRTLGAVGVSRLRSQPLLYRRLAHHLRDEGGESILVTIPDAGEVQFEQCASETRCRPGAFLIERSYEPYLFSYEAPADLWVLRIEVDGLAHRIGSLDRFCGRVFEASDGAGGMFADVVRLAWHRRAGMNDVTASRLGEQLVDLFALALTGGDPVSLASPTRQAHLMRIEAFLNANVARRELDPATVAAACGISTRYVHDLMRGTGRTLGEWIMELRLQGASRNLRGRPGVSIATIAYEHGFGDQAQFSRAFKRHFGCTPSDWRST